MSQPLVREVPTPVGLARAVVEGPSTGGCLVLGHGAGGGIDALDLRAARAAALSAGLQVVRVEQPWRVRGRRVAEAPPRLDLAWRAVVTALAADGALAGPLVLGGRSAGARVACRTADDLGAAAVLALAFPLHPPGPRHPPGPGPVPPPDRSRLPELLLPRVPRLVVQGERDRFGVPPASTGVQVHVVRAADHAFDVRRRDGRTGAEVAAELEQVVTAWLLALPERLRR